MWRKGYPHTLLVGMSIDAATVENSMEFSQKTKNRTTIQPSNSTPGYISRKETKTLIQNDTCTPVFIAAYLQLPRYGNNLSVHQQMNG